MSKKNLRTVSSSTNDGLGCLGDFPRADLANLPTPIEPMPNLSKHVGGVNLFIKRDDYTGLAMGGNKARQLEYYFGDALQKNADTVLITGALQSNFARLCAASARKLGMECHIQTEERVAKPSSLYRRSGNLLLSKIFGATLHSFAHGEDEEAADGRLEEIADGLRKQGRRPYVIHLGAKYPPLGALGYVVAAQELQQQVEDGGLSIDEIHVASGSGATHSGLLFGLRAIGCNTPVIGICVRRDRALQYQRIASNCRGIARMLNVENPVSDADILINDETLAPGYGKFGEPVIEAIKLVARQEGIILDPVYSGKAMAGTLGGLEPSDKGRSILFVHTGGQPVVFAYEDVIAPHLEAG